MRMFGGTLRCEHALADQAEAQVLLDGDKHFADLSALVIAAPRLLWSLVIIDRSLTRYTGLTSTDADSSTIRFTHLGLLREPPF